MTARKLYDGFGITELRTYAKEYKIAGRSKMTGAELLIAVRAVWVAQRVDNEQACIDSASGTIKPGTMLRYKSHPGCVVMATNTIMVDATYGSLYVYAEYATMCDNCGGKLFGGPVRAAEQHNRIAALRVEQGDAPARFFLFGLEALPMAGDATTEPTPSPAAAGLSAEQAHRASETLEDVFTDEGDAVVISEISEDGERAYCTGREVADWFRLADLTAKEDLKLGQTVVPF